MSDLTANLPSFVCKIPEIKTLLEAEQPEIEALYGEIEQIREGFLNVTENRTMTELYEKLFGFDRNEALSMDKRMEKLKARLYFSANTPLTKQKIKEILEKIGGTEVEISEDAQNSTMTVKFVGSIGIPRYLDDIKKEIELIRPFHISPIYEYLFITLAEHGNKTLLSIANRTLQELAESST